MQGGEFSNKAALHVLDAQARTARNEADRAINQGKRLGPAAPNIPPGSPYWAWGSGDATIPGRVVQDDNTALDPWGPADTRPTKAQPRQPTRHNPRGDVIRNLADGVGAAARGIVNEVGAKARELGGIKDQIVWDRGGYIDDGQGVRIRQPNSQEKIGAIGYFLKNGIEGKLILASIGEDGRRRYQGIDDRIYDVMSDGGIQVFDDVNGKWVPARVEEIRNMQPPVVDPNDQTRVYPYIPPADPEATRYDPAMMRGYGTTVHVAPEGERDLADMTTGPLPDGDATLVLLPSPEEIRSQMNEYPDYVQTGVWEPFAQAIESANREIGTHVQSLFAARNNSDRFSAEIRRIYGLRTIVDTRPIDLMRQFIAGMDNTVLAQAYLWRLHRFIERSGPGNNSQSRDDIFAVAPLMVLAPSEGGFQAYCRDRYSIELNDNSIGKLNKLRTQLEQDERVRRGDIIMLLGKYDNALQQAGSPLSSHS